jgi:hypothetical protein
MNTEITLVQKPIIKHALIEVGKSVTERILELNLENLIATEDTVKSLKQLRAELNKEFENWEAQRKTIKEAVANPYMEFEAVYKLEISEKYKKAVDLLKDKIAFVEDGIKSEKKANVIRYFNELCATESIDFLKFENLGLEINLSTSEKAYKDKCNEFVQRVQDDKILIDTMEFAAEMMTEYKRNGFNASAAIKSVRDRKENEKLEAERLRRQETNRRETMLRSISMVYGDLTRCFHFISDENIFIAQSDIENLSKEDFQKLYVDVESKIIAFRKSQEQTLFNQQTVAPTVQQATAAQATPPAPEPLPAPTETKPQEPEKTFTASFEVTGTMAQLKGLGQYMKDNGLTYKNI